MEGQALVNAVFQKTGVKISQDDPINIGAVMLSVLADEVVSKSAEKVRGASDALERTLLAAEPEAALRRAEASRENAVLNLKKTAEAIANTAQEITGSLAKMTQRRARLESLLSGDPTPEELAKAVAYVMEFARQEANFLHELEKAKENIKESMAGVGAFQKTLNGLASDIETVGVGVTNTKNVADAIDIHFESRSTSSALAALSSTAGQDAIKAAVRQEIQAAHQAGIGGVGDAGAWQRLMASPVAWCAMTVSALVGVAVTKFL